jgi:hypothetical protein
LQEETSTYSPIGNYHHFKNSINPSIMMSDATTNTSNNDKNVLPVLLASASVLMDSNQSDINTHRSVVELPCLDILEESDEYPMETIDIENGRPIPDAARMLVLAAHKRRMLQEGMVLPEKAKDAKTCCFSERKGEPKTCGTTTFLICVAMFIVFLFVLIGTITAKSDKALSRKRWTTPFEMHLDSSNSTIPNIDFQHARVFTKRSGVNEQEDCRVKCSEGVAFVYISELAQEVGDVDPTTTLNCICYLEDSFSMCNHTNRDIPFQSAILVSIVPLPEQIDC